MSFSYQLFPERSSDARGEQELQKKKGRRRRVVGKGRSDLRAVAYLRSRVPLLPASVHPNLHPLKKSSFLLPIIATKEKTSTL